MGVFSRFSEKVKQTIGFGVITVKDYTPTSNARNNAMVQEAAEFARKLQLLHSDVSAWSRSVAGRHMPCMGSTCSSMHERTCMSC